MSAYDQWKSDQRWDAFDSLASLIVGIVILLAMAWWIGGCATISVESPDGKSSASYRGTSIVGSEELSCGTLNQVTSCSVSCQNVSGLAQAIAPYLGGAAGIPLPAPASAPTPAPLVTH